MNKTFNKIDKTALEKTKPGMSFRRQKNRQFGDLTPHSRCYDSTSLGKVGNVAVETVSIR